MIDLYGMSSPNVMKAILMLEEVELAYRFHFVGVWKSEQFSPEFLRLNPNSKVPVIVDTDGPDGEPATVFESGAILIYLAEKTGRFLPKDGPQRYAALQWLMIQLTGVGPILGQHIHFSRFAPQSSDYGRNRYKSETLRLLGVLEERLGVSPFAAGESYTIADMALYPWLSLLEYIGLEPADFPNMQRWLSEIGQRPAARRMRDKAAEIAPLDKAARKSASNEDLDRFFGRGAFQRG